jgi:hypothetical protein
LFRVDDNKDIRGEFELILSRIEFEVLRASRGIAAHITL